MAASSKTIESAAEVLLKHLGREKALVVVRELRKVKGNESFTETIRLLCERLKLMGD